jgi:serine/threonine protein kinase
MYVVRDMLGNGAFGQVYRMLNAHAGTEMAMKRVFQSQPGTKPWKGLKREVEALKRCHHVSNAISPKRHLALLLIFLA